MRSSFNEMIIIKALRSRKILFEKEAKFKDLKASNGRPLRFDFKIFSNNGFFLVEYQGEQHYKESGVWGIREREETDKLKKDYCKQHNIPLFEVKYNENPIQKTMSILETLMLIPCQAPLQNGEGVSTIP